MNALRVKDSDGKIDPWAILGWIFNLIAGLALAFVLALDDRVTKIELWRAETAGTRYTASDAHRALEKDAAEKQAIWKSMNDMQSQWLREVGNISVSIAEIKTELKNMSKE